MVMFLYNKAARKHSPLCKESPAEVILLASLRHKTASGQQEAIKSWNYLADLLHTSWNSGVHNVCDINHPVLGELNKYKLNRGLSTLGYIILCLIGLYLFPLGQNGLIQVKEEGWTEFSRGLAVLLRGISQGQSPREIRRSNPASPRKTLSLPTLLLRFTFYFK